jgi:hypothetical protein
MDALSGGDESSYVKVLKPPRDQIEETDREEERRRQLRVLVEGQSIRSVAHEMYVGRNT